MRLPRLVSIVVALTVLLSGCGGNEISLAEYVEHVQAMVARAGDQADQLYASPEGAVLAAEGAALEDFTPQDLQTALEGIGAIETELLETASEIEPPEVVAEFHQLFFDDTYTRAREALAARAATASDWVELSATSEMGAYRAAVARDKQLCVDVQADLDATAGRAEFVETPWIPGELKEIVDAVLGCPAFPENPEDLFRP